MEVLNKKNDKVKKQLLEERKEILKLKEVLAKQMKKVTVYNDLENEFITKQSELDYLIKEYSKCELIEGNQKSLISLMHDDVKEKRIIYFQSPKKINNLQYKLII